MLKLALKKKKETSKGEMAHEEQSVKIELFTPLPL